MFCFECGKKLVPGAKFCMNCGANVAAYIEDSAYAEPEAVARKPETAPIPAPVPVPEPAVVTAEPVELEPKSVDVYVSDRELLNGNGVIIRDPSFVKAVRIRVPAGTPDGTRMKIPSVSICDESGISDRPVIVTLHVLPAEVQPHPEPEPVRQSAPQPEPEPVQQSAPQPAPAASGAAPMAPVSCKCFYQLCLPSEFRTFKFGGADNEGYATIDQTKISLSKKSKAVGLAFGMIGSLVEGKGKDYAVITRDMVVSFEKNVSNKGKLQYYLINLNDGKALRIGPGAFAGEDMERAMDAFLAS